MATAARALKMASKVDTS